MTLALLQIFCNPTYEKFVQPEIYSKAAGEVIFFVILLCGIVTLIWNPKNYESNMVKTVVGYNSPCVVWDTPPASWVGAPIWSFVVYLNMRYCVLMAQRALVLPDLPAWKRRISVLADVGYAISTAIVPIVFVIQPTEDHWRHHFAGFAQLIPMRFFAVASAYIQFPDRVTRMSQIFLTIYGILTFFEFLGGFGAVLFWNGGDPVINPYFLQAVDYLWFLSLPLAARFGPVTPPLAMTMEVRDDAQVDESSADDQRKLELAA